VLGLGVACSRHEGPLDPADLLIVNARIYTFNWDDPSPEGLPAPNAPVKDGRWEPDAQALAIRAGRITYVGPSQGALRLRGDNTRVFDVSGATVLPGLVDTHVHLSELGASLERVNLVGVATEQEAVDRVAERAARVPKGQWIVGWGWDEGAWADRYPDMRLLSERVPDHPVYLRGLHSFAAWGNRLAFEHAGITSSTTPPAGGEIRKGPDGRPTGILLNNATRLLADIIPAPTQEALQARILAALNTLGEAGYVMVHDAGVDAATLQALQTLSSSGRLPLRVSAMLSARDEALCRSWIASGPTRDDERMLVVRSVKAFYDGALGSRGAYLLADYSDRKGHRGLGGRAAGFNPELVTDMMAAGFQIAVHAIGDAGNRETLDFFEAAARREPSVRVGRHRIEHVQVLDPRDVLRVGPLGLIASMQPGHAVEDKAWAEDRLGPERLAGAYAWRSLRRAGARLIFNSDLPGSDYDIFYGLHSAVTRQSRDGQPQGGWQPQERVEAEEALRGYTVWAAWAGFVEGKTGVLAVGRWADATVMDIDPLQLGAGAKERLLDGRIRATIVGGRVVYEGR
jgi:predicted amidohydrolase YtcJ